MEALLSLFPQNDLTLLAFIVLLPLIGAAVNGIFGKRLGKEAVTLMGLAAIGGAFLLSVACFLMLFEAQHGKEEAVRLAWHGWDWLTLSLANGNPYTLSVGLSV